MGKNLNKKLHLISLGCTKNLVDAEVMLYKLKDYDLTDNIEEADLIIINTCGFIDSAKEESINTILEANQNRKDGSILVVTGCLTQRYQEELQKEIPEVDIFTGVGDYDKIKELIEKRESRFTQGSFLIDKEKRVISGSNYHAYIKLSEGCNQSCSFCAIPHFRGKLKSRTIQSITDEIKTLIDDGFYDFSFISQDSSSYLRDAGIKDGLIELINEVNKIDGVKSARILYLYPTTTSIELIDKIASSQKFHNYFDIPLQHIDDSMLKRMKRGMLSAKIKELLNHMRSKENSFIRTTFIVGHPYESDSEFEELLNFVEDFEFDRANVFGYSNEEDTSAFDMIDGKIDDLIIDSRADILGDAIENITLKKLKNLIGKTIDVVVDSQSSEHEYLLSARALNWGVDIDGEIYINDSELDKDIEFSKVYKATITDIAGDKLLATVLSEIE
jgi:ribosomal protein S12 methylthiotransferase RimO